MEGLIITTTAAQPGTLAPQAPKSHKILAEKPPQFKGKRKEYEWWKKALDLYLKVAWETLITSEDKILFTYSLMQEGEAYHFVQYYEEHIQAPTSQWDWTNFKN